MINPGYELIPDCPCATCPDEQERKYCDAEENCIKFTNWACSRVEKE